MPVKSKKSTKAATRKRTTKRSTKAATKKRTTKRSTKAATKKRSTKRSSFGVNASHLDMKLGYKKGRGFQQLQRQNRFGALDVPPSMRPVSSFREAGQFNRPFTIMPFGPPGRWLEPGPQAASSTSANSSSYGRIRRGRNRFGNNSLADKYVNPSGYLSTWYGQPRALPPSWNYLLLQGNNTFREGIDNPKLSQVMTPSAPYANQFGAYHPVTPRVMPNSYNSGFGSPMRRTNASAFGKRKKSNILNKSAKTSKGWGNTSKRLDRSSLPANCFLGKKMSYPFCNNDARIDCKGLLAAKQQASMKRKKSMVKKAKKMGKKHGCAWAM